MRSLLFLFSAFFFTAALARSCHKLEIFSSGGDVNEYRGLPSDCTKLDLYKSGLTDYDAFALAKDLVGHENLAWLSLSENKISEAGASALATAIEKNEVITALKLWDQKTPKDQDEIREETLDSITARCKKNKHNPYTKEEAAKLAKARKEEVVAEKVIKHVFDEGHGEFPAKGAKVKAHYTGTLINGEKFDSSRDRGQPFEFTLGQGQVIGCWDKGFASMKKGEKALLTCAPGEAYGDRGSPPKIPGGATLKFDVELIDFDKGFQESQKKEL